MEIKEIAETQEKGPIPVFEARKDNDSFMTFMFTGNGRMRVHHVKSEQKGDMKDMLDTVVEQFGEEEIEFYNVASKKLVNAVDGFELRERYSPASGKTHLLLVGEWEV